MVQRGGSLEGGVAGGESVAILSDHVSMETWSRVYKGGARGTVVVSRGSYGADWGTGMADRKAELEKKRKKLEQLRIASKQRKKEIADKDVSGCLLVRVA